MIFDFILLRQKK